MAKMTIIDAIESEKGFLNWFKGDLGSWKNWILILRYIFQLEVEGKRDRKFLMKVLGLKEWVPLKGLVKEVYVLGGRRAGKSSIISCILIYLAVFYDWGKSLRPGEKAYIHAISPTKDQSRQIMRFCSAILQSSELLKSFVVRETSWEIELSTGIIISVQSASFRSVRGYSCVACVFDELAWLKSPEGISLDEEILTAVRGSMINIPDGKIFCISSAFIKSGIMWSAYKKYFGKPEGHVYIQADSLSLNPLIDEATIKQAMADDPARAVGEFGAKFREDVSAFIPIEKVRACMMTDIGEIPAKKDIEYFGFVDAASGVGKAGDSMALGIGHKEGDGIILDLIREIRPPFVPAAAVREFCLLLARYRLSYAAADAYAIGYVSGEFEKSGIIVSKSPMTKTGLYINLLPEILNKKISILDEERLISQLGGLQRKALPGGKELIDHGLNQKDDLANVLAGVVAVIRSEAEGGFGEVLTGEDLDDIPADVIPAGEDDEVFIQTLGQQPGELGSPLEGEVFVSGEQLKSEGVRSMEKTVSTADSFWLAWLNERRFGNAGKEKKKELQFYGQQCYDRFWKEGKTIYSDQDLPRLAGRLKVHTGHTKYKIVGPAIVDYFLQICGFNYKRVLGSYERTGDLKAPAGIEAKPINYELFQAYELKGIAKKLGILFTADVTKGALISAIKDAKRAY